MAVPEPFTMEPQRALAGFGACAGPISVTQTSGAALIHLLIQQNMCYPESVSVQALVRWHIGGARRRKGMQRKSRK